MLKKQMARLNGLFFVCIFVFCQQVTAHGLPEFTQLIEQQSPAVVKINTVARKGRMPEFNIPHDQLPEMFRHFFDYHNRGSRPVQSMGSGFIISDDGYILTNHHVIEGADQIMVRLSDRREYSARIVGKDSRSDLALLKVDEKNLPTVKFAKAGQLKVGEWVLAIGSPFGLDYSASAGIVSAIGRSLPSEKNENYVPFIQTDVAINPGNSGGPLFNLKGEVVGINSQIYTRSGGSIGLSFAIPVSVALQVVEQLKDKGRVDRGWLGVMIQEVDRKLADSFQLDKPKGALVAQVVPGGPADNGGIQAGDIIVSFAGKAIKQSSDLPHVVGTITPGNKVDAIVIRAGREKTLKVRIGSLDGQSASTGMAPGESDAGGRLGVVIEPVDSRRARKWGINGGVTVTHVLPDSPAAQTGLREGDVIVQLGYESVATVEQFERVAEKLAADTLQPIRFYRRGQPTFRTIVINSN